MYKQWYKTNPKLTTLTLIGVIFSLLIYGVIIILGYHQTPQFAPASYRAYWENTNWILYPIFYPIIAYTLYASWHPFLSIWDPKPNTALSKFMPIKFVDEITIYRFIAICTASILTLIFTVSDIYPKIEVYLSANIEIQKFYIDKRADFFTKWLFESKALTSPNQAPLSQWLVLILCYIQQTITVYMGCLVLTQITIQIELYRSFLNRIKTDIGNPIELQKFITYFHTHWKITLIKFYVAISFSLTAPIAASYFHNGPPTPGLVMGHTLVVALLVIPIGFMLYIERNHKRSGLLIKNKPQKIQLTPRQTLLKRSIVIWMAIVFPSYITLLIMDWVMILG